MTKSNRYVQIIERIFENEYRPGARTVDFTRDQIEQVASDLGVKLPKNLGDLIYTFRYRDDLPDSILSKAPSGLSWIIVPAGRSRYRFLATNAATVVPQAGMTETKIPDSTPGMIAKYALSDEQSLLAKLRYNRLIDIFTCVTCYSLQSHLRSSVKVFGQVETDEIYIGVDKRGSHFVFPVQAKGGRDRISVVQIMQDLELCKEKFPLATCRPIAAQFMADEVIALFEFEQTKQSVGISAEKHYRLVPPDQLTPEDLRNYSSRRN